MFSTNFFNVHPWVSQKVKEKLPDNPPQSNSWAGKIVYPIAFATDRLGDALTWIPQKLWNAYSKEPDAVDALLYEFQDPYDKKIQKPSSKEQTKRTIVHCLVVISVALPVLDACGSICKGLARMNHKVKEHQKNTSEANKAIEKTKNLIALRKNLIVLHHLFDNEAEELLIEEPARQSPVRQTLIENSHLLIEKTLINEEEKITAEEKAKKLEKIVGSQDPIQRKFYAVLHSMKYTPNYQDYMTNKAVRVEADFIKKNTAALIAEIDQQLGVATPAYAEPYLTFFNDTTNNVGDLPPIVERAPAAAPAPAAPAPARPDGEEEALENELDAGIDPRPQEKGKEKEKARETEAPQKKQKRRDPAGKPQGHRKPNQPQHQVVGRDAYGKDIYVDSHGKRFVKRYNGERDYNVQYDRQQPMPQYGYPPPAYYPPQYPQQQAPFQGGGVDLRLPD